MFEAVALAAIARAVEHGGDVDLACASLARADPLVRGRARQRIRNAFVDALVSTTINKGDAGTRHALRIAYLTIGGAPPGADVIDDEGAVVAAYEAARAARPAREGRFWWASAVTILALAAAAGGGGIAVRRAVALPSAAQPSDRVAPPPRGAFASGGVPVPGPGDAAVRRALSTDVPAFLVALDRWSDARREGAAPAEVATLEAAVGEARGRALDAEARGALGDGAARALEAALEAARATAEAAPGKAADQAGDALLEATGALDDALAGAGLGYFVDSDVLSEGASGRRLVIMYAFTVERVDLFQAGDQAVRALHVRRLDTLNWSHALLGFTRPHLGAAVVLLDQLDEQVMTLLAPALGPSGAIDLFEPDAQDVGGKHQVSTTMRATEMVRAEYGALPGLDPAAGATLGELLGRRRAILRGWEKKARARGLGFTAPSKLRLPEGWDRSLRGFAPAAELDELGGLDERLREPALTRAFTVLRDALAASVERHEVQHRLDYASRARVMPRALADRVGPLESDGKERRGAASARAELSAYLAELARDARTTRVNLTLIARFLFDKRMHGTPECYAALTVFEGLTAELGTASTGPLLARGVIDRDETSNVYSRLTGVPPERLREGAKRLWERLFEAKLPELHRKDQIPMKSPPFTARTTWDRTENPLARALAEARGRAQALVDLTESNPTRAGFGGAELVALLGDPRGAAYAPVALGHPAAREAVARYYADRGLAVPADRVCLSASTSEAYGWLFKLLCERGDEVLVPAPSYPLFDFLASLEDVRLAPYPLLRRAGFRVDLEALEAAIGDRTRAVVLVHPNNPTGTFVRRGEAAAIEQLAARHGLALIVDEVFGDYAHGALPGDRLPSFAGERAALTFVLSGLSKVVATPQLKLGWIAVSGPEATAAEALGRLEVIADTYLSVNTPVQLALPEILARRGPLQEAIRARCLENLGALDGAIRALGGEAPVRRLPVDGGWYAMLEVPRTRDEDAWVELLVREDSVIVHPGYFFEVAEDGFLVVSLLPEPAAFREAIGKVARRVAEG